MLEDAKVFEKDETIQKKYKKTKPYFDRLHREFVKEALTDAHLSGLSAYLKSFKKWRKDRKLYQKELENVEMKLRKEVITFFDGMAQKWALDYAHLNMKKKDVELLFEEGVFALLKARYGSEKETEIVDESTGEQVSIFDSWKGFTGYFGKFFETRKNFYKDNGTSTAIATRIVDQNLRRFCENIDNYENIKQKIDFSDVEGNYNRSFDEIFSLEFYNQCLLQGGIDFYNTVLGGKTLDNGEKQKGLNELINLHKQQTDEKLPFFKNLDKQILSEKEKFIDEIEDKAALLESLKLFYKSAEIKIGSIKKLFADFVKNNDKYDLSEVYFSKEAFNTVSRKWTNETDGWEEALYDVLKKRKIVSSSAKKKDGGYSFPDFLALSCIKESLENLSVDLKFWKERYYLGSVDSECKGFLSGKELVWPQFLRIFSFEFESLFIREVIDIETNEKKEIGYDVFKQRLKHLLDEFELNVKNKVIIKEFADEILHIYQMAKYFAIEKKRKWLTEYETGDFYDNPAFGYMQFYENAYEEIVQMYNKLRNYLTKKPYSEEKWKLNFENPTLADGWDKNKESDNSAVLLRKDGKYYLGLMSRGNNKIFDSRHLAEFSNNIKTGKYEKVVYKYLPDAAKMIPKCSTQLKAVKNHFDNSTEDFEINTKAFIEPLCISRRTFNLNNIRYDKSDIFHITSDEKNGVKAFQKEYFRLSNDKNGYQTALHDWIDFCKNFLSKYESTNDFDLNTFKETNVYRSLDEFYGDIDRISYNVAFQDISEEYILQKNQNGELYLFQIRNKDWNEGAKGAKNLHTLYFEGLFSDENITANFPLKLNGQAEIFYRPKTKNLEKQKIVTHKNKVTLNKGEKAFHKNRYTENKIFFHVPLTLNRTQSDPKQFNVKINDFLANNPDINIIGVDRGEKHLAYYSVINQKAHILESDSLNTIGNVNYAEKLHEKAKNREQARKDWQDVEGIKNLKKGYISQVVRKLADLAVKYNAIIVFEDLNMRFKQIRGGIEKSVYQQFEKALIDKLNFLVDKGEKDAKKAGYLLKAYQLAAPFETFQKMGKQTGIIFYTQASYTSKIDPVTGWRPHLYLKYSGAEKAKADILKFSQIEFTSSRFEFTYDITKFRSGQKTYPKNTEWTVCSCVERWRWNRILNNNKGGYDYYKNLTDDYQALFQKFGVNTSAGDILRQVDRLETKGNEEFFRKFIFLFNLVCQIRNTNEKEKNSDKQDIILSPVEPFFDSRNSDGKKLPKNGDDNGAFNIARKGIVILKKISDFAKENGDCGKITWGDLYVSNVAWDDFVRG